MNRLVLNIRGTNGSGKSTIPMSMLDDPDMYVITKPYQGKPTKLQQFFRTMAGLCWVHTLTRLAVWIVLKIMR